MALVSTLRLGIDTIDAQIDAATPTALTFLTKPLPNGAGGQALVDSRKAKACPLLVRCKHHRVNARS